MKTFQKFSLLLALALTLNLHAAGDAAKFAGTIVDPQGNPVAGATVDFYQYPVRMSFGRSDLAAKQHATTDGQGAFELPAFSGMGVVVVKKAGHAPVWRTWYAAPPQEPQKIAFSTSATLAGVVVDEAGRPVADAEVWVASALNKARTDIGQPNFVFGNIARELFSAKTSADGKFRIENFPSDAQAMLLVKHPGKALRQTAKPLRYDELPFHAGQEDIILTLDPAGIVTGKVSARGTDQPLAHAVIALQPASPVGYFSFDMSAVVSAADGSFKISDVPTGAYQVMTAFTNEPIADWVADPVPVKVAAGQPASNVQIQAYKGGIVEVTVRGKNNHDPLAETGVSVNSEDFNRSGSTGTNGVVFFRVPPGQLTVFANKPDWSQAQAPATVTEGQTTSVTIELKPAFKVTGIVRDASGAPVAGVDVGVYPNYSGLGSGAKTDAHGHYELSWQQPTWAGSQNRTFYLLARHSERKLAAMQEMDETTKSLDVTLKPAMSVSGHMQDAKGKPVTEAIAYISIHQENSSYTISREPVHADEQGRIQAEALPMGERYGWYVSAKGYGSAHQEMEAADPKADHYDFSPLVLKLADRRLAGRVLGTDGKPAAGVQVWMNGDGQPNGNAITDTDGQFAYDAVCAGPVTVSANMKGAYGSAEAVGGDTNMVIRLNARNTYTPPTPQTLTGTVYDSAGKPAIGASVVVTPNWGPIDTAKTDADGAYSVNWQPQTGMRDVKYFIIARDVERNLAAIEAIDTNKTQVVLRLVPSLSISGTVQDAQGAPLAHANINLNMMAGNMGGMVEYQPIKVSADGAFTIPALPMGQQYHVYVSAKDFGSANKTVEKNQSRTNSIQLSPFKLKPADRQLAGRVLGAEGKPLPGAQVSINGNGQPNGNMRTDENGHFQFKVCAGPIQIFAWSQSGSGQNNSGNTQARGGDTNVVVKMGDRQQPQRANAMRENPLKPQPWTLNALVTWPLNHKAGTIVLLSVQAVVLLGTTGGIFWFTRKRG